jgi:bifunctional enzyme CysN/CysC
MTAAMLPTLEKIELLRISTAGSVDDGKSTLIGRLLYESKAVFQDQLAEAERASGAGELLNLALLTDGLRAEREQGITIDVAYRYLSTPRREFIIADTPGHAQYTRNMVTGASTADVAVILVDAARGVTEQSRRHLYVAAFMRVSHVVVCINKMDLAGYDQAVYDRLCAEVRAYAAAAGLPELTFLPIAALLGDNVATRSERMPWYGGPALLPYLEEVAVTRLTTEVGARFPVQLVNKPELGSHGNRRYAGQVAAGVLRPGDAVVVLPSGIGTRLRTVETFDGPLEQATPPLSGVVTLEDEIDISRGDMIAAAEAQPQQSQEIAATLCWMSTTPLRAGNRYLLKHTTRLVRAIVRELVYRVDVNTAAQEPGAQAFALNDIGRVQLRTTAPLFYDLYADCRATGSFILIDEATNETVAAGTIVA